MCLSLSLSVHSQLSHLDQGWSSEVHLCLILNHHGVVGHTRLIRPTGRRAPEDDRDGGRTTLGTDGQITEESTTLDE